MKTLLGFPQSFADYSSGILQDSAAGLLLPLFQVDHDVLGNIQSKSRSLRILQDDDGGSIAIHTDSHYGDAGIPSRILQLTPQDVVGSEQKRAEKEKQEILLKNPD